MPRFHFHLRADGRLFRDMDGTKCLDVAAAHRHAVGVARELMFNCEPRARLWSLWVEADGEASFDVFFADLDSSLVRLAPNIRTLAAETCRRNAELIDLIASARETMNESRMLIARVRGRPQLVYARSSGPSLA